MQDDDGTAYIAYSSEKNRVMHVARLTDDYKGVVNQYLRTMVLTPRNLNLCAVPRQGFAAHHDAAAEQASAGICRHELLECRVATQCRCVVQRMTPLLQIGMSREAPAMFKHGGVYFMLTSACTGWNPNRAEVFYARCGAMPPNLATGLLLNSAPCCCITAGAQHCHGRPALDQLGTALCYCQQQP